MIWGDYLAILVDDYYIPGSHFFLRGLGEYENDIEGLAIDQSPLEHEGREDPTFH